MATKPFKLRASLMACCLFIPCRAQTEHKSGWASGIAAQLAAPGRELHAENDHKWDMHDPIKLYANKVCTRKASMMSLQHEYVPACMLQGCIAVGNSART